MNSLDEDPDADIDVVESEFADALEGMELSLDQFVEAFQTNPILVRKVAKVTGYSTKEIGRLSAADLRGLFEAMDVDVSGSLTLDEFLSGLVELRREHRLELMEEDMKDEEAHMEHAYREALEAFQNANLGESDEMDLLAFASALQDPTLMEKISAATLLPMDFFESLSTQRLKDLFAEIDTDCSGSISFQEWVQALVRIRRDVIMMDKIEEQEARDAVMQHAEAAIEEGDENFNGEFEFSEFMDSFRNKLRFLRKVSLATGVPVEEFQAMQDEELQYMFEALDTDGDGTVSWDEFVNGLTDIRRSWNERTQQEDAAAEEEVLDDAYMEAANAFEDMDFEYTGELDLKQFMEALRDPNVVDKVVYATGLPMEWFGQMDEEGLAQLFQDIDTDASGTISFNEWVTALVDIRKQTYQQEVFEEKIEREEVANIVESAFDDADEDWSGEFSFAQFIEAFKNNPRFLRKVSIATEVPIEEYKMLCDEDLEELFNSLDTDFSGTISFEEFVTGLVDIRRDRLEQKQDDLANEQELALDEAYSKAMQAFDSAEFGFSADEIGFQEFAAAMQDPRMVEQIVEATQLPFEFFESMDENAIRGMFDELDEDSSGTLSFEEWIRALMKIRQATFRQIKLEEAAARQAVAAVAADAMDEADEDWSGEFEFEEFVKAFRTNPRFLRKVSNVTGVPVEQYQQLADQDLEDLFNALDTDFSGTVSFDEFVTGLVEIRMARQADLEDEITEYERNEFRRAKKKREPEGPAPYVPPAAVQRLAQLTDEPKALVAEIFAKMDEPGWGVDARPAVVVNFLKDLFLIADDKATKAYLEKAFPGRDLTWGLKLPECEALYQVALAAQPLSTATVRRSISAASLPAFKVADVHGQELGLRDVFEQHAGKCGSLSLNKVGDFLSATGVMDVAGYTPRLLDNFQQKRKGSAGVRFPEVVELCNSAMVRMLRQSSSLASLGDTSKSLPGPEPEPLVATKASSRAMQGVTEGVCRNCNNTGVDFLGRACSSCQHGLKARVICKNCNNTGTDFLGKSCSCAYGMKVKEVVCRSCNNTGIDFLGNPCSCPLGQKAKPVSLPPLDAAAVGSPGVAIKRRRQQKAKMLRSASAGQLSRF